MNNDKVVLKSARNLVKELLGSSTEEKSELYEIYYDIATKIYDFRTSKGWSQKKLAEVLGVSQAMVSKLESGEYNFTIEQLWKVACKLGWKLNIGFEGAKN